MKKILPFVLSLALVFSLASIVAAPFAFAADTGGRATQDTGGRDTNPTGGLQNPLKGVDSIGGFIYKIAGFVYSLSYAVVALFLIISGFKFVAAQGSEDKLKDAKKTFYYTIIGAVLLIGANVITEVVRNVINSFSTNPV